MNQKTVFLFQNIQNITKLHNEKSLKTNPQYWQPAILALHSNGYGYWTYWYGCGVNFIKFLYVFRLLSITVNIDNYLLLLMATLFSYRSALATWRVEFRATWRRYEPLSSHGRAFSGDVMACAICCTECPWWEGIKCGCGLCYRYLNKKLLSDRQQTALSPSTIAF